MAAAVQFICHAPVAVASHFVLDGRDQLGEPGVSQIFVHCRRAVVEGAARKIDHLTPPSNGAGFEPVTIDKFSSSLTRRRHGVFLKRSSTMVSWPTLRSRAAILASHSVMTDASASSVPSSPRSH